VLLGADGTSTLLDCFNSFVKSLIALSSFLSSTVQQLQPLLFRHVQLLKQFLLLITGIVWPRDAAIAHRQSGLPQLWLLLCRSSMLLLLRWWIRLPIGVFVSLLSSVGTLTLGKGQVLVRSHGRVLSQEALRGIVPRARFALSPAKTALLKKCILFHELLLLLCGRCLTILLEVVDIHRKPVVEYGKLHISGIGLPIIEVDLLRCAVLHG